MQTAQRRRFGVNFDICAYYDASKLKRSRNRPETTLALPCGLELNRAETLAAALHRIVTEPGEVLLRRWNWKAAFFSGSLRGLIFLVTSHRAGWGPALSAMTAEFVLRCATAGFYGSLTQALRHVRPAWHGSVAAMAGLPLLAHGLELLVHRVRGTPHLRAGLIASIAFTLLFTLFHLYAARQGAYVTGEHADSIAADIKRTPSLVTGFLGEARRWVRCAWYPKNKTKLS